MSSAKSGKVSEEERRRENTLAASLTRNFGAEGITSRGRREKEKICVGENKGSSSPGRCHLTAALNTVKQWLG